MWLGLLTWMTGSTGTAATTTATSATLSGITDAERSIRDDDPREVPLVARVVLPVYSDSTVEALRA